MGSRGGKWWDHYKGASVVASLLKTWYEVCLSISAGLKSILLNSQSSNLRGSSPAGCVLGDILPESWSCLTKKPKPLISLITLFLKGGL